MDSSVLAVTSCLLRPDAWVVLSLVPADASACGRATPGEIEELPDRDLAAPHGHDFDVAELRATTRARTCLVAGVRGAGALLVGFRSRSDAAASRGAVAALAAALGLCIPVAAAPLALDIKRLLLAPAQRPASHSGPEAGSGLVLSGAADAPAPAASPAGGPHAAPPAVEAAAASAERSESDVSAASTVPELPPRDPSACSREAAAPDKRDSFDACGAAPALAPAAPAWPPAAPLSARAAGTDAQDACAPPSVPASCGAQNGAAAGEPAGCGPGLRVAAASPGGSAARPAAPPVVDGPEKARVFAATGGRAEAAGDPAACKACTAAAAAAAAGVWDRSRLWPAFRKAQHEQAYARWQGMQMRQVSAAHTWLP